MIVSVRALRFNVTSLSKLQSVMYAFSSLKLRQHLSDASSIQGQSRARSSTDPLVHKPNIIASGRARHTASEHGRNSVEREIAVGLETPWRVVRQIPAWLVQPRARKQLEAAQLPSVYNKALGSLATVPFSTDCYLLVTLLLF